MSGMPKRRKKRSIGEPGGTAIFVAACRVVCAPPSILTRTEITAGFTFSTMSAKPTGAARASAPAAVRFCAMRRPGSRRQHRGRARRRARRRRDRRWWWRAGCDAARRTARFASWMSGSRSSHRAISICDSAEGRRRRPVRAIERWECAPYGVLSGGLNFGKVWRNLRSTILRRGNCAHGNGCNADVAAPVAQQSRERRRSVVAQSSVSRASRPR